MKNGLPAEEERPTGRGRTACRPKKNGLPAEEERAMTGPAKCIYNNRNYSMQPTFSDERNRICNQLYSSDEIWIDPKQATRHNMSTMTGSFVFLPSPAWLSVEAQIFSKRL
jgi:hypothetical protein